MKVIDNFYSEQSFNRIVEMFEAPITGWTLSHGITKSEDLKKHLDNYYFVHTVYKDLCPRSGWFEELIDVIQNPLYELLGLNMGVLTRIKCNLYPRTAVINKHPWHVDSVNKKQHGALLMINTCDGYTGFKDGTEVESVANRLVIFDAEKEHHSTSTTNASYRMTMNINYV